LGLNRFDLISNYWLACSGFSLATLKNGKNKINAETNEFDALIAEAEVNFNSADEVLAKYNPEMASV
jgi:hypothetical protein